MLFLPSYIRWLTNFDTFTSPKTGSGRMILFFGLALRIVLFVFCSGLSFVFFNASTGAFTQPY